MNTIWYRFYSEKDSYEIHFNTTEMSIGDIKQEIIKRRNMYKFPENFDLIFYDEENFTEIEDKDLVKPMKHLIIKRFPHYKRENNFVNIVRDPHDISMNKINENGLRRVEPQKIIRYTEPLEKIKKKLNREMINKQFKCKLCQKSDDETLINTVISKCCKETFCLNCYNKNDKNCPIPNCGNVKVGYVVNEAENKLVKTLLKILKKKEEEEKILKAAAIQQMNIIFENKGNNLPNSNEITNNQRLLNTNLSNQNIDNSASKNNIEQQFNISNIDSTNLNLMQNQNPSFSLIEGSQFFIIKSSNKENIEKSKKKSVWATTLVNSNKLNEAFKKGKVILIFSASGTQSYQGYAIMTSCTEESPSNLWQIENNIKLGGNFSVAWLCFCELSFSKAKHLQNPKKNGDLVIKSRDCTELSQNIGYELCKLCYEQEKKDMANNPQQAKVQINIEKINQEISNNRIKQLKKNNKPSNNNNERNDNNSNNNNKPNENINNPNANNVIPNQIPQMMPMPQPFYIPVYNPFWRTIPMQPHDPNSQNAFVPAVSNPQPQKQDTESDKNKKEKEKEKERYKDRDKNKRPHKKDYYRRDRDRNRRNRSRSRSREKDRGNGSRSRSRNKRSRSSSSNSSRSEGRSRYSKSYN